MSPRVAIVLLTCALLASALGCDENDFDFERMRDQAKLEAFEATRFFENGSSLQRPPEGTVERQQITGPSALRDGSSAGVYLTELPLPVDRPLLVRGQNRFRLFCATCHGVLGDGDSQVAENMVLRPPPSLHEDRLRELPAGRLYAVVSQGYGLMPSYAGELSVQDRWAVVAYVQALQLSQSVRLAELPRELREGAQKWLQ